MIILQIAFWTFFATIGATITMIVLKKRVADPKRPFVLFAFVVFLLSLIPIYLHVGILHDFPSSLLMEAVDALIAMHVTDSLLISSFVLRFAR